MKQVLIIALLAVSFSCKKKENSPAETTPTQQPVVTPPVVSVKVNGNDFTYNTTSSYYINPTRSVNFLNNTTSEQISIRFLSAPTTGTFTLVKYGNPSIQYYKNSNLHSSVNGTLIVNAVSTNTNNIITKLNCTFNCQTDTNTTTSTFYNLTNGSFDYNQ